MTDPKLKAVEIMEDFMSCRILFPFMSPTMDGIAERKRHQQCKIMALKAVDLVIIANPTSIKAMKYKDSNFVAEQHISEANFWEEVKRELEQM